jgi:type II secretion system protein E
MATTVPDPSESAARPPTTQHADPAERSHRGPYPDPAAATAEPDHRREMEALIRSERAGREQSLSDLTGEQAARLQKAKIEHRLAEDADLLRILAEQNGMEYVSLSELPELGKDLKILRLIPSDLAKEMKVFPVDEGADGRLRVAISDPLDVTIADNLRLLTGRDITPVVATEDEILDRIDLHYGMGDDTLEKMVEEIEESEVENVIGAQMDVDLSDLEAIANEPTVIKLVSLLLVNVIKDRASDLHIEPFGGTLRIRYRVDGVLREVPAPPKRLQAGIISRFKVMAAMNIAEIRRPQDGRIRLTLAGRDVDLRVSTLPTVHGESMVMRILDKSMMMLGLDQIGMFDQCYDHFRSVIKKPNGIILVTGPTGSGKTTTLYAGIQDINDPGEKIITTEDPVEYQVSGLVQININETVGLTFAGCLRAILRQDPDIILVGEIRDIDTAQIAVQASLTGHLVFSTLHTNSAAATISRLIDMGVEPFLLVSTLEAVIGQRLVRTVCPACARPFTPSAELLAEFGAKPADTTAMDFLQGEGCDECGETGYKGRIGIFEIMMLSDALGELILQRATADEIQNLAVKEGLITMRQDGWQKAQIGVTTLDEVTHHTPRDSRSALVQQMESQLRREGVRKPDRAPVEIAQEHLTDLRESSLPWEGEAGANVTPQSGAEAGPV